MSQVLHTNITKDNDVTDQVNDVTHQVNDVTNQVLHCEISIIKGTSIVAWHFCI